MVGTNWRFTWLYCSSFGYARRPFQNIGCGPNWVVSMGVWNHQPVKDSEVVEDLPLCFFRMLPFFLCPGCKWVAWSSLSSSIIYGPEVVNMGCWLRCAFPIAYQVFLSVSLLPQSPYQCLSWNQEKWDCHKWFLTARIWDSRMAHFLPQLAQLGLHASFIWL